MFIFSVRKVPKQTNHCFHLLFTKIKLSVIVLFKLLRIITDFFFIYFTSYDHIGRYSRFWLLCTRI